MDYQTMEDPKATRRQVLTAQLASVEQDHLVQSEALASQRGAPGVTEDAAAESERQLKFLEHRANYYRSELQKLSGK